MQQASGKFMNSHESYKLLSDASKVYEIVASREKKNSFKYFWLKHQNQNFNFPVAKSRVEIIQVFSFKIDTIATWMFSIW